MLDACIKTSHAARRVDGLLRQLAIELRHRCVFAAQPAHNFQGVAQSGKNLRVENFRICQFPQPGAEREQVPGKVAAVDAGYIKRQERLERARVVPIIEMPAMPLQALHRGEGCVRAFDHPA